jgi:outer membrane protein assembly factor BamB
MRRVFALTIVSGLWLSGAASGRADEGKTTPSPKTDDKAPARRDERSAPDLSLLSAPERTGVVLKSQFPRRPAVRWTLEAEEGDLGEPWLDDGVIYFGTRVFQAGARGMLCAVKLEDGSFVWKNTALGEASVPTSKGDRLYVSTRNRLVALSKVDGSIVWSHNLNDDATESAPLIVNDRIIVADYSGKVYAVSVDGDRLWEHDIVADAPPSPPNFEQNRAVISGKAARPRTASSDGTTVFQPIFDQSRVVAIDVASGKRRWSFQAKGWIYGEPVVAADRVFIGSQDDHFYCLDKKSGEVIWKFKTRSRIEAAGAFANGSVYFGSCDGRFYRVDAKTGKEVWNYQTPREEGTYPAIYSSPVCTEESVYFGSFDGHLYCLKIADGSLTWRIKTADGAEVVSTPATDGREFVLTIRKNFQKKGRNAIVVIGAEKTE